jgi:hypothetical protein
MRKFKKIMCIVSVALLLVNAPNYQFNTVARVPIIQGSVAISEASDEEETITSAETDEFGNQVDGWSLTSNFPLYAMIKAEDIFLYGIANNTTGYGMILYQEGQGTYFNWPDLVKYDWMPALSCFDYNGDGEKEVAVIIYSNKGTACLETNLYILEPQRRKWGDEKHGGYLLSYTNHSLLSVDFTEWFTQDFITQLSEDRRELMIQFRGKDYLANTEWVGTDPERWNGLQGVKCADIIEFQFIDNHEIAVSVAMGLDFNDWDISQTIFGHVDAKVNFDGENFLLSDYQLTIDIR